MKTTEDVITFARQWDEAMVRNDAEEIGKFMADDWVIVGTNGGITLREDFLDTIRSGDLTHDRMDAGDIRVKIYDNTGVLTSRGTSAGKFKGESFSFFEWSTSVFIFRNDEWKCVITMLAESMTQ